MYSAKQREYYNHDRSIVCERLHITKNEYNSFRRYGQSLHSIYENQCNGFKTITGAWDEVAEKKANDKETLIVAKVIALAKSLKLFYYFQTDPRGATIYLSFDPIEDNNYNRLGAECIY